MIRRRARGFPMWFGMFNPFLVTFVEEKPKCLLTLKNYVDKMLVVNLVELRQWTRG